VRKVETKKRCASTFQTTDYSFVQGCRAKRAQKLDFPLCHYFTWITFNCKGNKWYRAGRPADRS